MVLYDSFGLEGAGAIHVYRVNGFHDRFTDAMAPVAVPSPFGELATVRRLLFLRGRWDHIRDSSSPHREELASEDSELHVGSLSLSASSICFGSKMNGTILHGTDSQPIGEHGIIIFDGSCGVCSTFVGRRKELFEKHGFTVAPYQEEWVREVAGIDESTLSQAIHVRTREGKLLRGVALFRYISGKVWWLAPASLLLRIEFFEPGFEAVYSFISKRRRTISKLCGLQSRDLYK